MPFSRQVEDVRDDRSRDRPLSLIGRKFSCQCCSKLTMTFTPAARACWTLTKIHGRSNHRPRTETGNEVSCDRIATRPTEEADHQGLVPPRHRSSPSGTCQQGREENGMNDFMPEVSHESTAGSHSSCPSGRRFFGRAGPAPPRAAGEPSCPPDPATGRYPHCRSRRAGSRCRSWH